MTGSCGADIGEASTDVAPSWSASGSRAPIEWLDKPADGDGIYVADDQDGWGYLSYSELAARSLQVAGVLREGGLQAGDRVCIVMPTSHLAMATIYAVWVSGCTVTLIAPPSVGMDSSYVENVSAIVRQVNPSVMVTSPDLADAMSPVIGRAGVSVRPVTLSEATVDRAEPIDGAGELAECALLQFTSGSTGGSRAVIVSWSNLAANIQSISELIGWCPGDRSVSWLPLYHDMGLISVLMAVANQGTVWLMRPDHFIRDPSRWIRAMSGAQHTISPSFGLSYTARRLRPDDVAGLDLSSWRSLVMGAEPVDLAASHTFCRLMTPAGFDPSALRAAYGLAESTLLVCGTSAREPISAIRVDKSSLRMDERVTVLDTTRFTGQQLNGVGWMAGLGRAGESVEILGKDGRPMPEGRLGEVAVSSPSVAIGYRGEDLNGRAPTRFAGNGVLHTGDAGFFFGGQLYVLGRMGSALKVRGKSVFMEDIDSRLASATGIPQGKLCAVADSGVGVPGIAVFVESNAGDWVPTVRQLLRSDLGPAADVHIIVGPRGLIRRTSSGKPRRAAMWKLFLSGDLAGAVVVDNPVIGARARHHTHERDSVEGVRVLLAKTLEVVEVVEDATILLEGSLAEGFGNDASDVDLLALVPGDDDTPTMPTVLFIDGRRIEMRTRSVGQLRRQLATATAAFADPAVEPLARAGGDLLNRCQRFLHGTVIRRGSRFDLFLELQSMAPYSEFVRWMSRWWLARARQSLRQAVASATLGAHADARAWARDGLQQAAKGWIAGLGEAYLETKWLALQLERAGDDTTVAEYWELDAALAENVEDLPVDVLNAVVALADRFGVTGVVNEPGVVRFARAGTVTSWPIGDTLHVIRDDQDVFALTGQAKTAWRSVVFRRPVLEAVERIGRGDLLAEFARLGLVALAWSDGSVITPATAMSEPAGPYTCPPSNKTPLVTIGGAGADRPIALSPLTARRFVECGGNLIWANIILENAREDLLGAVRACQWNVAGTAAMRMINASVRILASASGCAPMPPDVAFIATVERVLPEHTGEREPLLAALRTALADCSRGLGNSSTDASSMLAHLDELVSRVRGITKSPFPPSMDSREQWRATLDLGYQWLRVVGYLDANVPLDEARDLLTAGGHQPHAKDAR